VDVVAATLMGFDPDRVPITRQAFTPRGFPLASGPPGSVSCVSNHASWNGSLDLLAASPDRYRFRPHFGWIGRIESPR